MTAIGNIRDIARPQIDFRFGWKSGYATHITPMTESDWTAPAPGIEVP